MILTRCPVCAVELPPLTAKQCSRCKTRYCGPECQKTHWEGGHDKLCKKIRKGGGAEHYNANKKYAEAVSIAAEACAEDTKGQTCYICTQALHWKTKEGLVRGCSCRGTAGFAHVSCLAEQAKILVAEADENNLDQKDLSLRYLRWDECGLCEQRYHGVVACALGWACWKTYLSRPERDWARQSASRQLGAGLFHAKRYEDALLVYQAELSMIMRNREPLEQVLITQNNLASTYQVLGREQEALPMLRDVCYGTIMLKDGQHERNAAAANNYASSLLNLERFEEAKALLRKTMPVAQHFLGNCNEITLYLRWSYAQSLRCADCATLDDLREAVTILEETVSNFRRVLGGAHPRMAELERALRQSRAALHARESSVEFFQNVVAAMTRGSA